VSPSTRLLVGYALNIPLVVAFAFFVSRAPFLGPRPRIRFALLGGLMLADAAAMLWFDCTAATAGYLVALAGLSSISFADDQTVGLTRALGRSTFAVYICAVATMAALAYVYLPITTFLTSPGEIGIHFERLIARGTREAMVVVYVAAALYALGISPRVKLLFAYLAITSALLALIYGYVYPFGYPMMTGLMFEQLPIPRSHLVLRAVVDLLTVGGAAIASAVAIERLGPRRILIGLALVNVTLFTASAISVVRDAVVSEQGLEGQQLSERPIRFAKDKDNVLILFLDRLMGGFVEGILQEEPDLKARLDGFTWYPQTLAAGQNSIAGLHPLLGGYDYTPREMNKRDEPLRDLAVESYAILPYNFTRKGYDANLVNPAGLGFTVKGDCSFLDIDGLACSHIPLSVTKKVAKEHKLPMQALAKSLYADLLVMLGLMRATPYLIRAVIQQKGPWRPFIDHSAATTLRAWAELKSLPLLTYPRAERSNLNIVFNMLPHEPYFMGEDCQPRAHWMRFRKRTYKKRGHASRRSLQHYVTAKCALKLAAEYFEWMKEAGVYDNTKIVIVSDHGISGKVLDKSSRAVAGKTTKNLYVRTRSALFVKDRGARGAMRTSEEFAPNAEVPRIVCEEIGGCVNPYLGNKTIEAHGRDRPFYVDFVPWQFSRQKRNRFVVQKRMVLMSGRPYDRSDWKVIGTDD
jgi:hypothetical protein